MLRGDKNRVLWQSEDFFSGERNRKLASTAAYITELEMCVGSHATSFSLYSFLSLSRSTHTLTHSRSQPTLHILVHGSPGRYTVYYCTTRGLKPSQYSHKNDLYPKAAVFCPFLQPSFYLLQTRSSKKSVIVCSPSCRSKPVCCFFFCKAQKEKFFTHLFCM